MSSSLATARLVRHALATTAALGRLSSRPGAAALYRRPARQLPLITGRGVGASRGLAGGKVKMTWSYQGERVEVEAEEGQTLLEVAHGNDIELEGACGGELACSTCHVVFEKGVYEALPEKKEEEEDMLDLAWGLTDTSRLGCQIKVSPVLEGALVTIPEETNNMMDGDEKNKA